MNKYSVLMSVYKNENAEYLKEAIQSILSQTVLPDEIVLVEDGPLTKELYDVIDLFCNYLHIIKNENNMGLGISLQIGVQQCRNEFIARMDTDDISLSDRCEKQLKYFDKHPDLAIVGGQIEEFVDVTSNIIGKRYVPIENNEISKFIKKRCPFNHMTVMFKKSKVLNAGNYQDWFWNEDYYLWIRMFLKGYNFANLPDTLVLARVGNDMYKRRGGINYFKSEKKLQRYMLDNKVISCWRYFLNVLERFIIQVFMPNSLRGFIFKKFARK